MWYIYSENHSKINKLDDVTYISFKKWKNISNEISRLFNPLHNEAKMYIHTYIHTYFFHVN